jgi:hypothetical protein
MENESTANKMGYWVFSYYMASIEYGKKCHSTAVAHHHVTLD